LAAVTSDTHCFWKPSNIERGIVYIDGSHGKRTSMVMNNVYIVHMTSNREIFMMLDTIDMHGQLVHLRIRFSYSQELAGEQDVTSEAETTGRLKLKSSPRFQWLDQRPEDSTQVECGCLSRRPPVMQLRIPAESSVRCAWEGFREQLLCDTLDTCSWRQRRWPLFLRGLTRLCLTTPSSLARTNIHG
jgi:hypothetical protein